MDPTMVRLRHEGDVVVQDCDVYIGRRQTQGGWHLKKFKEDPELWLQHLLDLEGQRLGCWCDPGLACHGHVIIEFYRDVKASMDDENACADWIVKLFD